jgi:integrase
MGHRYHVHESVVQGAVKDAVRRARLARSASCNTLRHCFATHLLGDGYAIRPVQELLSHKDVGTTMIYTHVLNRGGQGYRAPLTGRDGASEPGSRFRKLKVVRELDSLPAGPC